jgi:hypothetical protein
MRPPAASRRSGQVLLVGILVAAALSFGTVFQALSAGDHAHAGATASLAVLTDGLGIVVLAAVSLQLMLGYHLVRLPMPRFRRVHSRTGWVVLALLAAHAVPALVHSVTPPVTLTPLLLDVAGLVAAGLVAVLILSGYRRIPKALDARVLHGLVVPFAAAVALGHALVAVLHAVTG